MLFTDREIRKGMDVFTADGRRLGTVLGVQTEPQPKDGPARPRPEEVSYATGEALGPAVTQSIGNAGPDTQSAARAYGAAARHHTRAVTRFVCAEWWGVLHRRILDASTVQTVSLERVVLRLKSTEL